MTPSLPSSQAPEGRDAVLGLFLKRQGMLAGYVYSLAEDWDVVEDTVQETAAFICDHWEDYRPGTHFSAWLRAVARNRCLEVLRRKRRGAAGAVDVSDLSDIVPAAAWDRQDEFTARRQDALARCIAALPQEHRRVIEMRYRDGRSVPEMTAALRKRSEALYKILSRLRQVLKTCVERRLAGGLA